MTARPAHSLDLRPGDRVAVQLEADYPYRWLGRVTSVDARGRPIFTPDNRQIPPVVLSWQPVVFLEVSPAEAAWGP